MEFTKVVQLRTSVRSFSGEKIPFNDLRKMAEIAGMAPCIGGKEVWKFVAITNRELMSQMEAAVRNKYNSILPPEAESANEGVKNAVESFSTIFTKAPAMFAILASPYTALIDRVLSQTSYSHSDINKMRNYPDIQTIGAAIENLILAAVDLGYAACWQTGPMVAKEELSSIIGVKPPFSLIAFVAVGKPDHEITPRHRRPVEEIFEVIE